MEQRTYDVRAMTGEKMKLETGMRVRLRSGGPVMTIRAISGDQAYCDWFAGSELRHGTFAVATLEPSAPGNETDADHRE